MEVSGWRQAFGKGKGVAAQELDFVCQARGDAEDFVSESGERCGETGGLSGEGGYSRLGLGR